VSRGQEYSVFTLHERIAEVCGDAANPLPIIDGQKSHKKITREGYNGTHFSAESWVLRQWEKIWLVRKMNVKNALNGDGSTHENMNDDIVRCIVGFDDIVRCIVGFAGFDKMLKIGDEIRSVQPLINTLLEPKT